MKRARSKKSAQTTELAGPRLAERLQSERDRLFRAMGVIACCQFACESVCTDSDPEDIGRALEAAYGLIDKAAEQLGVMCDEQGRNDVAGARP
jgi:hypothetical protein